MASLLSSVAPAAAEGELTFKGRTITILVAGGAGGGVDLYARTIAPYLSKQLPGEPPVVVSNMGGSGGIQGVQYLYNVAAKDGTAIGTTNVGPVIDAALGSAAARAFDLKQLRWIGSLVKGDTVCAVWHGSKVKSLDDARKAEVAMSSTGATSSPMRAALLMNALLGTRFRPVAGYDGGTALLAIERGEVEGSCSTLSSMRTARSEWLEHRRIVPLVHVSMSVDPAFPNVPRAIDLVTREEDRQLLEFYQLPAEFNNPYYLPPGVSDGAVAAHRKAFSAVVRDPVYLAEAVRRRQGITARNGAEVEAMALSLMSAPRGVVARTIALTTPK